MALPETGLKFSEIADGGAANAALPTGTGRGAAFLTGSPPPPADDALDALWFGMTF